MTRTRWDTNSRIQILIGSTSERPDIIPRRLAASRDGFQRGGGGGAGKGITPPSPAARTAASGRSADAKSPSSTVMPAAVPRRERSATVALRRSCSGNDYRQKSLNRFGASSV
jgi:hypothetical protein